MPSLDPHSSRDPRAPRELAASAPARRRDAWLLSTDDGLLLELGPVLGDRYRARPIESDALLSEAGATPWLLVFDATVRHDARAVAARIEQQHPMAPIIVICADGHSAQWASALHRGSVCAIVERGNVTGKAWPDALRTAEQRLDNAALVTTSSSLAALSAADNPFRQKQRYALLLVPLLAAGATLWYFYGRSAPGTASAPAAASAVPAAAPTAVTATKGTSAQGTTTATAQPTAPKRSPLELLSDARVAFRDEKALLPRGDGTPTGDSALELYAQVLAQDPENEEARDGMRRLFSVARARIQSDLSAGKLDEATRLLSSFKGVGLDSAATSKLEADVAAARPRWLIAQARSALANNELDTATQLISQIATGGGDRSVLSDLRRSLETHAADAQLVDLATRVRAAITAGALLEPAADNARTRLTAMQQLGRNHALTLGVQRELQAALLARAQSALRSQQPEGAQPWLNAAAELGSTPELVAARKQWQTALDAGTQRAAVALTPAAPASASSTSDATSKPDFISARPARPLNAVFPARALEKGQKGQVVVEFMLDRKGRANEPRVVEASLPGVFDAAALQAVQSGRFDTTLLGASGLPRRARLLVSFR